MSTKTLWRKLPVLVLLTICLSNVSDFILAAQDSPGKQGSQVKSNISPFQNMAETTFPEIAGIKFQKPAAGQPCPVQVEITEADNKGQVKITAVKLIYYVAGDFKKPYEITMSKGRGNRYAAIIPKMGSGSQVDFIIRAEDSNGNVATQAIPSATNWVSSIPDDDNPSESIEDSLDLLGMSAGYDNKFIYVQCNLQGKISAGTMDPPFVHVYAIKFTNPDLDPRENLYAGKALCYIPLAIGGEFSDKDNESYWRQLLGSKEKYLKVKKTGAIFANIQDAFAQKAGVAFPDAEYQLKAEGNKLTAKISRAALGKNPSGYLRIVSFTCRNKSLGSLFPLYMNCSNFLVLYTSSQSYMVK
jgi:hypothetical protein